MIYRKTSCLLILFLFLSSPLTIYGKEEESSDNHKSWKYGLGCLGSGFIEEDEICKDFSSSIEALPLPNSLDWRDYTGKNWVTAVKNQGAFGSCVAFGTIAALESKLKIFYNDSSWTLDLSEQHLYEFGGGLPEGGWYVNEALDYLKIFGSPEEWCNPYDYETLFEYTTYKDWRLYTYKTKNWGWITGTSYIIKESLFSGPLVAIMEVYSNFHDYQGGIYTPSGDYQGLHCVTLVGYNDTAGYWIVKNSWGTEWGENGYFRIAYGQCGIEAEVSTFEVVNNRWPNLWMTLHRIQAVDSIESILEGEAEWQYEVNIWNGEEWLLEVGIVDHPYSEGANDSIIDHHYRFTVDENTTSIRIYLFERDEWSEYDIADISSYPGGGYDNYNGTFPEGAWYYGDYVLTNNTLTGDTYNIENGWYKTSGLFDGSEFIDENDANLWFNISTTPPKISPQLSLVKDRILSAPPNSVYFIKTGNIWDDATFYAFYAYKENEQIITPPTQSSSSSSYLDDDGKPLFYGDIITFGGRYANRMVAYYEDVGIATIGYGNNGTHHLFTQIKDGSHIYAIELETYNESEKDYFVFQIYNYDDRCIFSEWGICAEGTYAGGICFIDIILPQVEDYDQAYYIFSWTDLNDDSMPQPEEISLETFGS